MPIICKDFARTNLFIMEIDGFSDSKYLINSVSYDRSDIAFSVLCDENYEVYEYFTKASMEKTKISASITYLNKNLECICIQKVTFEICDDFKINFSWNNNSYLNELYIRGDVKSSEFIRLKKQKKVDFDSNLFFENKTNRIGTAKEMLGIQRKQADYDSYMFGMYNGMVYMLSLFTDEKPEYMEKPKKWRKPSRLKMLWLHVTGKDKPIKS